MASSVKRLQPLSRLTRIVQWGERRGLESKYSACYVNVVLMALFGFQDTFDSLMLTNNFQSNSKDPVEIDNLEKAQQLLRKVVNVFRNKGFVKFATIHMLREQLAFNCGMRVAFPHQLLQNYDVHVLDKIRNILDYSFQQVPSFEGVVSQLQSKFNLGISSPTQVTLLPPKISYSSSNSQFEVIITQHFFAEWADASEFLLSLFVLFQVPSPITLSTKQDSNFETTEKHHYIIVSLPNDLSYATLSSLIHEEYVSQNTPKNTFLTSIDGPFFCILLQRMHPALTNQVRPIPVYVEFSLDLFGTIWKLVSVIIQKDGHFMVVCHCPITQTWYYFNDKHEEIKSESELDSWIPIVRQLSPAFGFNGFVNIQSEEATLQSLIATNGFIFFYTRT